MSAASRLTSTAPTILIPRPTRLAASANPRERPPPPAEEVDDPDPGGRGLVVGPARRREVLGVGAQPHTSSQAVIVRGVGGLCRDQPGQRRDPQGRATAEAYARRHLGDYDDRLRSAAMSWLDDRSRIRETPAVRRTGSVHIRGYTRPSPRHSARHPKTGPARRRPVDPDELHAPGQNPPTKTPRVPMDYCGTSTEGMTPSILRT